MLTVFVTSRLHLQFHWAEGQMAEVVGLAGSIVGIVFFGIQFATVLETYVEAIAESDQRLRDIAFGVGATASALKQLHAILEAVEADEPRTGDQRQGPQ
ncbi:hypothetical protein JX265_003776 [Neoarthrinium moseri]|uniref:Uncharacterized protein n=1 Tax=Neoarthrinium moseri TaxID=1658444 RepID=A0A9P9WSX2_9PEZI|nr:uncharacterized protein JN550_002519 [Neoarthrinium moseri]KAI1843880.1 hypothetical protein JX266_009936 [Neoarthrinium moseri]KAI1875090.1 hypothetical protein JN550_002519 [Neoarthrinium moseri]KAI1877768.1 hypothetical protein JX265_003776 [Neoarthrinium moseri]